MIVLQKLIRRSRESKSAATKAKAFFVILQQYDLLQWNQALALCYYYRIRKTARAV